MLQGHDLAHKQHILHSWEMLSQRCGNQLTTAWEGKYNLTSPPKSPFVAVLDTYDAPQQQACLPCTSLPQPSCTDSPSASVETLPKVMSMKSLSSNVVQSI